MSQSLQVLAKSCELNPILGILSILCLQERVHVALDLPRSILLAPAKIYALRKKVRSGPHGWISVVLEVGKNLSVAPR